MELTYPLSDGPLVFGLFIGDGIRTKSPLGPNDQWPDLLKSYSPSIASLPHPACILWGEDLILLHNEYWKDVTGSDVKEGRQRRDSLSEHTVSALHALLHGETPRTVTCEELLGKQPAHGEKFLVLLSPILDPDTQDAKGVVAQLLPEHDSLQQLDNKKAQGSSKDTSDDNEAPTDRTSIKKLTDNITLDEHPFFHRFAEMLPTGFAILNHKAEAVFVNMLFYELTTQRSEDKSFKRWPESIHPEDFERIMNAYREAFKSQTRLRTEFRAQGMDSPWRLLLLTPLGNENLRHVSLREYGGFICSIVDITSEKSAELAQRKAAREAQERKEQQERFIDMISHEIRNPLSAVLHCAEDIMDTVRKEKKEDIDVAEIIEAAETISLCISHQKNIVDDVLSFSKLDASMLLLSPRSVQPIRQLRNTLKMFQPESRKHQMELEYRVDYSYEEHRVDWVVADLARIGQVLINLVSNAIKFTSKKDGEKRITVCVGASVEQPTCYPPNVVFFGSDDPTYRMDATTTSEWGNGEVVYIMVAVRDTGIGISENGQTKLFERFRQATPKTEETYGGSGLGLNISRKLCHLHGGEIGVSSKEGDGSTFGFFFKVRRSEQQKSSDGCTAEDDEMEADVISRHMCSSGIELPGNIHEEDVPKTVKRSPPIHVPEANQNTVGDNRWEQSAEVAAKVGEDSAGRYIARERLNEAEEQKIKKAAQGRRRSKQPRRSEGETMAKEADPTNERHAGPQPHILVVEDNIVNQRILFRKLESKGFRVTTANNGRDAVNTIKGAPTASATSTPFDCILMDQEMPVLDGNAATKAIRELEVQGIIGRIPILGVTANVRDAQKDDMISAGMDDVIHKPYGIEEMAENINRLIGKT